MKQRPLTILILIPVLLALAIGAGCSSKSKQERYLERAENYFTSGQLEKARIEFMNVLRMDGANAQAIKRLGQIYYSQREIQQAAPFLMKAIELLPEDLDLRLKMGLIYLTAGKPDRAKKEALAALDLDSSNDQAMMILSNTPRTPEEIQEVRETIEGLRRDAEDKASFHAALGNLFLRESNLEAAESEFKQSLALDENAHGAYRTLGDIYWQEGDLEQAEQNFRKAAEIAPKASLPQLRLAEFLLKNGQAEEAKSRLKAISDEFPKYVPALVARAKIAFVEKQWDACSLLIQQILANDASNYDGLLLQGKVHLAQGEFAEAVDKFNQMKTRFPNSAELRYQLALANLLNRDVTEAINQLDQTITLDSNFDAAILLLSELEIRTGDASSAITRLTGLIKEHPEILKAHLLLADAYRTRGTLQNAVDVYQGLEKSFPDNAQVSFLMGLTLRQLDRTQEARAAFERTLELAPDYLPAVNQLLELDMLDQDPETAIQRIQEQIDRHPEAPGPRFLLAKIYFSRKEYDQSEALLQKAIELVPEFSDAYLLLARQYVLAGNPQTALEKLGESLIQKPDDVPSLMLQGMIHEQLEDYSQAAVSYEKLLDVNPRFEPAVNNLAYLYSERLGKPEEAFQLAQQAYKLSPQDPFAADTYGWVLFKQKEYSWAMSLLKESAEKLPGHPEVQFHIGMTHYYMGEEAPARAAFERALELDNDFPGNEEAKRRLSILNLSDQSDASQQIAQLKSLVVESPEDPMIQIRLGALYRSAGQPERAKTAYEDALSINPNLAAALAGLAGLYANEFNDLAQALDYARKARQLAPADPELIWTLGRVALKSKDAKWALSLLRESVRKLPENPELQFELAQAAYYRGQLDEAETAIQKVDSAEKDFAHKKDALKLRNMIELLRSPDDLAGAGDKVEAALRQDPDYVPALMLRALLEERREDFGAARSTCQEILRLRPDFPLAQKELARITLDHGGDAEQALEYAVKAREALPNDPELAKTMGRIVYQQQDYDWAVRLFNECTDALPDDGEIYYYLGLAYHELKQQASSQNALEKALTLNLTDQQIKTAKQILADQALN